MNKKKLIMTVLCICLLALAVLSGCQLSNTIVPSDHKNDGWVKVTLFYNGGTSGGYYFHERFVAQNARLPFPGASGSHLSEPIRQAHTLAGWYQIDSNYFKSRQVKRTKTVVDEHGVSTQEEVYDQAGDVIWDTQYYIEGYDYMNGGPNLGLLDLADEQANDIFVKTDKWNFEIDRVKDDIVLVPLWQSAREYTYIIEADSLMDPQDDYFKLRVGETGYEFTSLMGADGSIRKPSDFTNPVYLPQIPNYQVEGLYLDPRFISEVPFDPQTGLYYPDDGGTERFPIYVRHISSNYTIVNSKSDLNYSSTTAYKYTFHTDNDGNLKGLYLRNNIDLEGAVLNFRSQIDSGGNSRDLTFTSEIRGNGYTISNFVVEITQAQSKQYYGAIFASIGEQFSGASIQNIKFDDFTVRFQRNDSITNYLSVGIAINSLADDIPPSATLRNIEITNMRIIDLPATSFKVAKFEYHQDNDRLVEEQSVATDANGELIVTGEDEYGNPIYQMETVYRIYSDDGALRTPYVLQEDNWNNHRTPIVNTAHGVDFRYNENDEQGSAFNKVTGCNAQKATIIDWSPEDYEKTINSTNYFLLPNLESVTMGDTYKFYGWFDEYGFQYGPGRPAPSASLTVYAMFVRE